MRSTLPPEDAELLLEMCLDAEERCDQRIRESRDQGDSLAGTRAIEQKERYESLKRRIVAGIQGDRSALMEDSMVFPERVKNLRGKPEC